MARRRTSPTRWAAAIAVSIVLVAGYLMFKPERSPSGETTAGVASKPQDVTLAGVAQNGSLSNNPKPKNNSIDNSTLQQEAPVSNTPDYADGLKLLELGNRSAKNRDWVNARTQLSEALQAGLPEEKASSARQALYSMADMMLFSPGRIAGDPLVGTYTIKPGESLTRIAKQYKITAELLARINRIPDKNKIRAGQNLKVIDGPFHAVIHRDTYSMHVYLQDCLVKQFAVGLGQEGSTPSGVWKVKDKLINPTYYPPRGGRIIAADDPENPLGERWLGLEGISGEAVGQLRYGVHGTIEPESIGKNASLGCVRLHNEDVEFLFDLLVTEHSRMTVLD